MIELNGFHHTKKWPDYGQTIIDPPRVNPLLSAALRYADLGYAVFPCVPGRKTPLTEHGFRDASTDPDTIEEWWSKNPDANIGMATAGLVVVDVDGADNEWPDRELTGGALATTPRGGRHYYFRQPAGKAWRNTASKISVNVDIRADGGYVIVSPSKCGSNCYAWCETFELTDGPSELPEPPAWLIDELDKLSKGNLSGVLSNPKAKPTPGGSIPEGSRNARFASLGGTMRRVGLGADAIAAALLVHNKVECDPPMSDDEVVKIAKSMDRYEPEVPENGTDDSHCKITTLCDVEPMNVEYLWPQRIPIGMFTVIAGDPGVGKSTVALDIACRLSRGTPYPGSEALPNPVGDTILILGEDPAQIVRKRVDNAGGDPSRIHILEGVQRPQQDGYSDVRLDIDAHRLDAILSERPDVRLLIVDPLDAFMGEADAHKKAEVVSVLKGLATLAEDRGIAVIGVLHLRKAGSDTSAYRVMGSLGFVSAPRAVWAISRDKTTREVRLMTVIKFNLDREPSGLSYRIEDAGVIEWGTEPVVTTADVALSDSRPDANRAGAVAKKWLLEALANGPVDSGDLREAAEGAGVSWSTLGRIRAAAGVVAARKTGAPGWHWLIDTDDEGVYSGKSAACP